MKDGCNGAKEHQEPVESCCIAKLESGKGRERRRD